MVRRSFGLLLLFLWNLFLVFLSLLEKRPLNVCRRRRSGEGSINIYPRVQYLLSIYAFRSPSVFHVLDDYLSVTHFYKQSNNNLVINKLLNDISAIRPYRNTVLKCGKNAIKRGAQGMRKGRRGNLGHCLFLSSCAVEKEEDPAILCWLAH